MIRTGGGPRGFGARSPGVIYNRIGADMRLDIDATVLYALGDTKRTLTASGHSRFDSPYNTRLYKGCRPPRSRHRAGSLKRRWIPLPVTGSNY